VTETIDIKTIHPELERAAAPTQFGFFGIGTRLYGQRDPNAQTRSSVSTLYFTVFFIPVIPIASYRITQQGSNRYVLGKVPLSPLAKKARRVVATSLAIAILGAGTYGYLTSPGYIAGRQLSEADALVAAGSQAKAAALYRKVFETGPDDLHERAGSALQGLVARESVAAMPAGELAGTIDTVRSISARRLHLDDARLYADAKARFVGLQAPSPVQAHQVFHSIVDLAGDDATFKALDEPLLLAVLERDAGNVDAVDELARMRFDRGEQDSALALLKTVEKNLGSREGARILGQAYAAQGDHARAYPLLTAYMGDRLKDLDAAEKRYLGLQKSLMQAEFEKLKGGKGNPAFYARLEKAPEDQQQALVEEEIANRLRGNQALESAMQDYRGKAKIVPVAIDYGSVLLRRAESMADPQARKAELKRAESTFLSIRVLAGDSDEYHLYLGQVYYWLGKQAEGHQQFDDLLNKYRRSPDALLSVAGILRTIGMEAESIALSKEAYDGAGDNEHRYAAAQLLAQTVAEPKDRMVWLQRSDPRAPSVLMDLATEKGYAAERDGEFGQAATQFRQAIQRAASLPESSATFNNTALVQLALYRVSGDKAALDQGIALMEKAIELVPSDSILLGNVANVLTNSAMRAMFAGKIDHALLQSDPALEDLDYLYADQKGYDEYRARVAADPLMQRATEYLKKSLLLAPKAARNYFTLLQVAAFTKDEALLAYIDEKAAKNNVDLEAMKKASSDYLHDVDQAEARSNLRTRLAVLRKVERDPGTPELTRIVARSKVAELLLQQVQDGALASADEAVALLESAQQLHPSSATSDLLARALMTQASLATAAASPSYLQARRQAGRNLGDDVLVALTLYRNGPDAALLQKQPAAQRAFAMLEQQVQRFPESTRTTTWATLVHLKPAVAQALERSIRASAISRFQDSIERVLYAQSSQAAVDSFLYNEVLGKPLDSSAVLAEYERAHTYWPKQLL
jgi:hypothetical protein